MAGRAVVRARLRPALPGPAFGVADDLEVDVAAVLGEAARGHGERLCVKDGVGDVQKDLDGSTSRAGAGPGRLRHAGVDEAADVEVGAVVVRPAPLAENDDRPGEFRIGAGEKTRARRDGSVVDVDAREIPAAEPRPQVAPDLRGVHGAHDEHLAAVPVGGQETLDAGRALEVPADDEAVVPERVEHLPRVDELLPVAEGVDDRARHEAQDADADQPAQEGHQEHRRGGDRAGDAVERLDRPHGPGRRRHLLQAPPEAREESGRPAGTDRHPAAGRRQQGEEQKDAHGGEQLHPEAGEDVFVEELFHFADPLVCFAVGRFCANCGRAARSFFQSLSLSVFQAHLSANSGRGLCSSGWMDVDASLPPRTLPFKGKPGGWRGSHPAAIPAPSRGRSLRR